MNENTTGKMTPEKENHLLRLQVRGLRKRYATLRKKFDKLQMPYFEGVKIYEAGDPELDKVFHISTTEYALANGVKTREMIRMLVEAGIMHSVCNLKYLDNPKENGAMAMYVHHDYGHLKRMCLYWNADGVKMLDDVLRANGKTPRVAID